MLPMRELRAARVGLLLAASTMERACFASLTIYLATYLQQSYAVEFSRLALALLLVIVATVFGRVVIIATTGRWLQRKFMPQVKSESVMLLLGVTFWIVLSSIPYVWPFVQAGLLVASLGLALTARYRVGWITTERAKD